MDGESFGSGVGLLISSFCAMFLFGLALIVPFALYFIDRQARIRDKAFIVRQTRIRNLALIISAILFLLSLVFLASGGGEYFITYGLIFLIYSAIASFLLIIFPPPNIFDK